MNSRLSKLKLLGLLAILFIATPTAVYAVAGQWSANGNTIYYNDGNIGIGTSTPGWKFQMNTPGSATSFLINGDGTGTTNRMFQVSNGSTNLMAFLANGNLGLGTTGPTWKLQIDTPGTGSALLVNGDGSGSTNRLFQVSNGTDKNLVFLANGNVGIGTTNPQRKLSVNGTILAKEVIVSTNASNWPDYVFADDYQLMPIKSLSEFVETHKHLPGIPTATEVTETGISLGEMQRLQMEKIEELTLYLIALQQQVEGLSND